MTSSGAGGVAALRPLPGLGPAGGGSAMRRINSSWSFHPKLQGKDSRCLGSSCFIDRCSLSLLASRGEQKVSELPPCHKYPISKLPEELSPRQFSFDGNWRNVMLPTAGGERAFMSSLGQKDCRESVMMPNCLEGIQGSKINKMPVLHVRKGLVPDAPKPHEISFCNGYGTSSATSYLPSTTLLQNQKNEFMENRSKAATRSCSWLSLPRRQKNYQFPDPLSGASATYLRRLTMIATLEYDTIRQEKSKRIKKARF
ncbi:putative uncharacterized protein C8orf89 homolog isoform X1 [Rhinatrema bivittatum]|uniref:putative uncharacterized protein C8orf89 homolog isoform X1 n=1 Tax=Rhinatrema bivittatum TaxID=194408 RepID=UPI00112CF0CF|nr:putative uncharacterized protein C8orf89 homolog isoform X1 [Rhinatrema bivittatum]